MEIAEKRGRVADCWFWFGRGRVLQMELFVTCIV
jgi:hypothetical protein